MSEQPAWPPASAGSWRSAWLALCMALCLSGCAAFRSYDKELNQTTNLAAEGKVDDAIKQLNKNNKGKDKDLLYYLELGMMQRWVDRYPDSQKAWSSANETVQAWEQTAKTDPSKLGSSIASFVINDKVRPYEGHDYEKVMLLTYIGSTIWPWASTTTPVSPSSRRTSSKP